MSRIRPILFIILFSFLIFQPNLFAIQPATPYGSDDESDEPLNLEAHFFTGPDNEHYLTFSHDGSEEGVVDLRLAVLQTLEEIEAMTWEDLLAEELPHSVLDDPDVVYVGTLIIPEDIVENEKAEEILNIAFEEEIWPTWDHQITINLKGKVNSCTLLIGTNLQSTNLLNEYGTQGPSSPAGNNYRPRNLSTANLYRRAHGDAASMKAVRRHEKKLNKKGRAISRKLRRQFGLPKALDFGYPF